MDKVKRPIDKIDISANKRGLQSHRNVRLVETDRIERLGDETEPFVFCTSDVQYYLSKSNVMEESSTPGRMALHLFHDSCEAILPKNMDFVVMFNMS